MEADAEEERSSVGSDSTAHEVSGDKSGSKKRKAGNGSRSPRSHQSVSLTSSVDVGSSSTRSKQARKDVAYPSSAGANSHEHSSRRSTSRAESSGGHWAKKQVRGKTIKYWRLPPPTELTESDGTPPPFDIMPDPLEAKKKAEVKVVEAIHEEYHRYARGGADRFFYLVKVG